MRDQWVSGNQNRAAGASYAALLGPCSILGVATCYNGSINHKSINITYLLLLVSTILIICNMQAKP